MKKLIAILLALTMVLSGAALADAAQQPAVEPIDFGDFTMELDPEMPGEVYEKNSGEMLFQTRRIFGSNSTGACFLKSSS